MHTVILWSISVCSCQYRVILLVGKWRLEGCSSIVCFIGQTVDGAIFKRNLFVACVKLCMHAVFACLQHAHRSCLLLAVHASCTIATIFDKYFSERAGGGVVPACHKRSQQVHCIFHKKACRNSTFYVCTSHACNFVPDFEQCQGKLNESSLRCSFLLMQEHRNWCSAEQHGTVHRWSSMAAKSITRILPNGCVASTTCPSSEMSCIQSGHGFLNLTFCRSHVHLCCCVSIVGTGCCTGT